MGETSDVKCQVCGAPAQAGVTRCAYCGNELSTVTSTSPKPPQPGPFAPPSGPVARPYPPPPIVPPPVIRRPARSGSPAIIIVMVSMIMLVGAGMSVFFLIRPSGPPQPAQMPQMPQMPQSPSMPWNPQAAPVAVGAPIQVAQPVRGTFSPGLPVDSGGYPHLDYPLTITTGGNFTIDLMSDNTSNYDPYLRLLLNGQELAHDDDGGDGSLQSRIQMMLGPGSYIVRVSKFGAGQLSSPTGFTLAVIGPPQPVAAPPSVPTSPGGGSTTPGTSAGQIIVNESQIVVRGGLDRAAVARSVRRHMGAINSCYERALVRNPTMSGTVLFMFNISESGRVTSVTVGSTTLNDVAVTNCITAVLRRFRLPSGSSGDVTLPMDFMAGR